MQATLAELAALVDGWLVGDGDLVIYGAAPLCNAVPGQITLFDSNGADRNNKLTNTRASAVLASHRNPPQEEMPTILVDDVHAAFAAILKHFNPPRRRRRTGVSPLAVISPSAKLDEDVDVYPYATIGDEVFVGAGSTIHSGVHIMAGSKIGRDVTIFPNAVLYEDTIIGARCIIHAGALLGAYGFGYTQVDGRHVLSAQLGNVILGADVEVGAGTTIDRGTYGPTMVGEGTKIDDLVMIAHNCRIGRHNMLCSQVGIAGSTSTGDYVVMAGQVGVRDHVHIGRGAVLGAMAGVINDVADGERVIGIPATPERDQKLKQAAFTKLPEMRRQLKMLQRAVDKLLEQETGRKEVKKDDIARAA
ncbi:MAG TPA: UDP-3-O-(3-hydroxymyristoyl)glucosamine N-acyltransferase [Thermoguttaceae bacterium]|nr:UDP-3-O-(3-hydroxymyristoyl)glucosamine N-acyltransferase [Thermoguttaceae bacterium]